ncbi:MAG: hypothetical protein Q7R48_02490 [bacterium]|nr:hypothetical protein [bacterium]
MAHQYTQEQLEKIYTKLPEELQEALFSVETSNTLWEIAERYDVLNEKYTEITKYVGYVLMGLMMPAELEEVLKKDLKMPVKTAKEVAREINRFVFYPVKPSLEGLHKMEIEVSARVVTPQPSVIETETPLPAEQELEKKQGGPDSYRESIE